MIFSHTWPPHWQNVHIWHGHMSHKMLATTKAILSMKPDNLSINEKSVTFVVFFHIHFASATTNSWNLQRISFMILEIAVSNWRPTINLNHFSMKKKNSWIMWFAISWMKYLKRKQSMNVLYKTSQLPPSLRHHRHNHHYNTTMFYNP